jgi:hypothetical protein
VCGHPRLCQPGLASPLPTRPPACLPTCSDWGGLGDGPPAAATLTTASGRRLEGDLVFKCVGARPATAAFAASLTAEQLGPASSIAVEPTLQVVGWRNVFAAGDCSSVEEEKTAALAGLSGRPWETVKEGGSCVCRASQPAEVPAWKIILMRYNTFCLK